MFFKIAASLIGGDGAGKKEGREGRTEGDGGGGGREEGERDSEIESEREREDPPVERSYARV